MLRKYCQVFLLISLSFLGVSCAGARYLSEEDMYYALPNFSIPQEIDLSGSPFNTLVKRAFHNDPEGHFFMENQLHYIHVLNTGEDALLARIHLFRAAQKAIYIQTFIWRNDESGRYVIQELIKAAQRGVKVKILVDYMGTTDDVDLISHFVVAHPNIEIKFYNPNADRINASAIQMMEALALRFKKVNQRMHNKVILIDDRILITGGRNFQNDYFDKSRGRNFKDRDLLVIGPVVKAATRSFEKYWAFKLAVKARDLVDIQNNIQKKLYAKSITQKDFSFGDLFNDINKHAEDKNYIQTHFVDKMFPVKKVMFICDEPGKNLTAGLRGGGQALRELGHILGQARTSIVAQTPYLVLDKKILRIVKKFRKKNPQLEILLSTNSLAATDHITAYAAAFRQKKTFLKDLRFRIFEFKPVPKDIQGMLPNYGANEEQTFPAQSAGVIGDLLDTFSFEPKERHMCIHAKSFVIDDEIAWVGSFNLDPRSFHLNTEAGIVVWDKTIALALKKGIQRDISPQNSWSVGIKRVPLIQPINDLMTSLSMNLPVADVWPFRYTALYELREGKEPVPFYDKSFYNHYKLAGFFPEISISPQEIRLRLFKTFIGLVEPII